MLPELLETGIMVGYIVKDRSNDRPPTRAFANFIGHQKMGYIELLLGVEGFAETRRDHFKWQLGSVTLADIQIDNCRFRVRFQQRSNGIEDYGSDAIKVIE